MDLYTERIKWDKRTKSLEIAGTTGTGMVAR